MLKPRTVLRSLVLIFLSSWIGIAVQPAAGPTDRYPVRAGD